MEHDHAIGVGGSEVEVVQDGEHAEVTLRSERA